MNKRPDKLPAFTLLETIIAMGVTAIVIGFTYSAYIIVTHSYLSFSTKNKHMQTVILLDKLLQRDFNRAVRITAGDHLIRFQLDSGAIQYEFQRDRVIRNQGKPDTLPVQILNLRTAFEQQEIDSTASDTARLIDEAQLALILEKQQIQYHYHKLYSSANLFNANPYAIH
ncbi:MAG: hypothetical protein AAGC65_01755 [Mucilaginibacter sp.]|uniref:PulJ/GspJ family protein n=1 Tax=Mucilaginibacter sp. TaxID=1882438 RepID=UPI0031A7534F